jgi:hypothetical protein
MHALVRTGYPVWLELESSMPGIYYAAQVYKHICFRCD